VDGIEDLLNTRSGIHASCVERPFLGCCVVFLKRCQRRKNQGKKREGDNKAEGWTDRWISFALSLDCSNQSRKGNEAKLTCSRKIRRGCSASKGVLWENAQAERRVMVRSQERDRRRKEGPKEW
jgi:hypothetical protein